MKHKKLVPGVMVTLLPFISHVAYADWATKVEDDVFTSGSKAMMIDIKPELNGVVFDCSKDILKVSYLERDDTTDLPENIPAELVFKVDQNAPVTFNAYTIIRNSNYFGVSSGTTTEERSIKLLLNELKLAHRHVLVGIHYLINDRKYSYTFDISGSTTAVNQFTKACNIDLSGSPQKS